MDQRPITRRATGLAGIGAAVLFGVGNALWAFDQPHAGASTRTILAFYKHTSGGIIAGASLSLVSCALLVLFASGVRAILREHEGDDLFATTAFGGVLLLIGAGLGAETINMVGALRAGDDQLTPELARVLFEISYVLGYNAAGVGIGVALLATSTIALRTRGLLPRWFALPLLIAGLAFLTPLSRFLLAPAVLLLIAVSAQLLRTPTSRHGPQPPRATRLFPSTPSSPSRI
ncbi:MAG TPA: hypothetical protein VMG62_07120 [Solirubrobacteraceae bacterium]|nr:hypothetical protein [Solirubrobacteraceae bacterium]